LVVRSASTVTSFNYTLRLGAVGQRYSTTCRDAAKEVE